YGGEHGAVQALWANIAFSFAGLKKLERPGMNLDRFVDPAFEAGMLARSMAGVLGDPVGSGEPGDPDHWLVGGPDREADVVLTLAADSRAQLNDEVAQVVS